MFEDDGAMLVKGQTFTLDADKTLGDAKRVHLPHPEILSSLEPGHTILIDDGKLRLRVKSVKEGSRRDRGRGRRPDFQPQGRQPARHRRSRSPP